MSTISVELSERMTTAHETKGQRYLAAPVFGRPDAAAAAKLFIVTAGAPESVADRAASVRRHGPADLRRRRAAVRREIWSS